MDRMRSGRGGCGRLVIMGSNYVEKCRQSIWACVTYTCSFALNLVSGNSYENITACVTYMGNRDAGR